MYANLFSDPDGEIFSAFFDVYRTLVRLSQMYVPASSPLLSVSVTYSIPRIALKVYKWTEITYPPAQCVNIAVSQVSLLTVRGFLMLPSYLSRGMHVGCRKVDQDWIVKDCTPSARSEQILYICMLSCSFSRTVMRCKVKTLYIYKTRTEHLKCRVCMPGKRAVQLLLYSVAKSSAGDVPTQANHYVYIQISPSSCHPDRLYLYSCNSEILLTRASVYPEYL